MFVSYRCPVSLFEKYIFTSLHKMALSVSHINSSSFLRFGSIVGIAKDGSKKTVEFADDANLFQVLVGAGVLSKTGTCMGNKACGKCLVKHVSGKAPEIDEDEKDLLEEAPKGARIACAITLSGENNGAVFQAI